jgi:hypothetical protein
MPIRMPLFVWNEETPHYETSKPTIGLELYFNTLFPLEYGQFG